MEDRLSRDDIPASCPRLAPNAEGVMILDQILQSLSENSSDRQEADKLARLGFLEWVWSLPDDADLTEQAIAAGRYADAYDQSTPAVTVFRGFLSEAGAAHIEPVRRGGKRGRHPPL